MRPASRKELAEERRDPATDDEDFLPLVPPRLPSAADKEKDLQCWILPPVWQVPAAALEHEVPKDSRERAEDASVLGRQAEGQALRNIINKLSDERNSRDFPLKHYHMSTSQFKKRTTPLDIPRKN